MRAIFPFFHLSNQLSGLYEPTHAGVISPRALVKAQTAIATLHGCRVVSDEVVRVVRLGENNFVVELKDSSPLHARRVVVCAGAFVNARPLLPDSKGGHVQLKLTITQAQVIRAEVSAQTAAKLTTMPAFIAKVDAMRVYGLPPLRYPDGKFYIKLGGEWDHWKNRVFSSATEVVDWYRSSPTATSSESRDLISSLRALLPFTELLSFQQDTCVFDETPTTQPYIGFVSTNVVVVSGGNGYAAKSSDEIGRLAALCVLHGPGWGELAGVNERSLAPQTLTAASKL
eukprot:c18330_g1_i2.p1 GENE.c18330_g1_i2~~c18330_g1_i2.p1  ORF type:complete len:285 (-),score=55.84 c18330_g1_i2:27-881(-)